MPGDSVLVEFVKQLGTPPFVFTIGVICILAFLASKSLPIIREISVKKIEIEVSREKRKAEEYESEAERDRIRTEVIAKQNEILSTLVRTIDAQQLQMAGLISALDESRSRSRAMGETIRDTNSKVSEIHTLIVKTGHHTSCD